VRIARPVVLTHFVYRVPHRVQRHQFRIRDLADYRRKTTGRKRTDGARGAFDGLSNQALAPDNSESSIRLIYSPICIALPAPDKPFFR
jgi:hypothetical protein